MKKAGILTGALVGALLTAPLIAIFYLASQAAGLPFVPFDLLDWAARTLPGAVITFGIDLIVSIITVLNLGETSSAAKTAEQFLAIAGLFVTGIAAGAVLFAALRNRPIKPHYLPGLIVGALIGAPVALISNATNQSATAEPAVSFIWIIVAFLAWGAALSWAHHDLRGEEPVHTGEPMASVEQMNRRQFMLRLGGATAAITVVGAGLGALAGPEEPTPEIALDAAEGPWSDNNPLPNADAALEPAPGTRPEFTKVDDHYRIDINALPPVIREQDWRLEISGLVRQPVALTLDDIRNNYEPMHQFVTLSCISNPIGGDLISTQRWTGVSLQQILREVGPMEGADYLYITSQDGFYESLPRTMVVADERIMLTYAWDGLPLPPEHGFPLRLYIPDLYGMKQPKWIIRIELTDRFEEGYWVRRGWDEIARVRATSVIDTVAVDSLIQDGERVLVPIGGIAYAGARGIRTVEVRVDDGAWQEARLREPISDLTWVIWRYNWPFEAGEHRFYVRCVDGKGQPQIEDDRGARPSGATGIHMRQASF